MKVDSSDTQGSKSTPILLGVGIAVLTTGLGVLTWNTVSGIQDASKKVENIPLKRKDEHVFISEEAEQKLLFPHGRHKDDKIPHTPAGQAYEHARGLHRANNLEGAILSYQRSVDLMKADIAKGNTDPEDDVRLARSYQGLGQCLFGLNKYAESLENYNLAVKLHPTSRSIYRYRAMCHDQLGQPKLAEADRDRARKTKKREDPRSVMIDELSKDLPDTNL